MRTKPYYYKQTDPRWRWVMYSRKGINDPSQTIGSSGCGPTCAAMVIRTLRGLDVTPINTCDWSVAHGYRTIEHGTDWAYFVPQLAQYGIKAHQTMDAAETVKALQDGKMVIGRATKGLWTKSGHFILAWKVENDKIHVNDPNSELQRKTVAPLATWKKECWPFWIVDETEEASLMYDRLDAVPEWGRATIKKLLDRKLLRGSGTAVDEHGYPVSLGLSEDLLRALVILDRARAFEEKV